MEMTLHTQFNPALPESSLICSFEPFPLVSGRMGMIGDESDPVRSDVQRGEIRVTVPHGLTISRKAGPVVLEAPKMPAMTAGEVYLFAKNGQNGFKFGDEMVAIVPRPKARPVIGQKGKRWRDWQMTFGDWVGNAGENDMKITLDRRNVGNCTESVSPECDHLLSAMLLGGQFRPV